MMKTPNESPPPVPGEVYVQYMPHPKQRLLHRSTAGEILFGGAAGPGKSRAIREECLSWCVEIPGLQAYLFRRTFPELERNHILPSRAEWPKRIGRYNSQEHRWYFPNKSILHMCHCQHESDMFNYQGAEFHVLAIDELTSFPESIYTYLMSRVRCTIERLGYSKKIPYVVCATNPGGIGHAWVKARFVDYCGKEGGRRKVPKVIGGPRVREYIPAILNDNPTMTLADPEYESRLRSLPEPYRTAYMTGDWDIFVGQSFDFRIRDHVIKPRPVPTEAPLIMTFDYGFGKPFSVGWWWMDFDDRLYRFAELYGCVPGRPDEGLRLSHREIAERILAVEASEGIGGRRILRLSDPTCFNKTPDARGGGQGPSSAEDFARAGVVLQPGDPNRKQGIRQFHERLRIRPDAERDQDGRLVELPMLIVYDTCEAFIRTIPLLNPDPRKPDDVDTRQEDHVYDEAKLACMGRPLRTGFDGPVAGGASAGRGIQTLKAGRAF